MDAPANDPLAQAIQRELRAMLADPSTLPDEFRKWLPTYLEVNPPVIPASFVSGATAGSFKPGMIADYAGDPSTAPEGWLFCDGTQYPPGKYGPLFNAIGTLWNTGGETSGYFRVPNLNGRATVGKGTNADVNTVGQTDGLAEASRSPKHNSSVTDSGHHHDFGNTINTAGGVSAAAGTDNGTHLAQTSTNTTGITVGPGGSRPTDTVAYAVVHKIIKT